MVSTPDQKTEEIEFESMMQANFGERDLGEIVDDVTSTSFTEFSNLEELNDQSITLPSDWLALASNTSYVIENQGPRKNEDLFEPQFGNEPLQLESKGIIDRIVEQKRQLVSKNKFLRDNESSEESDSDLAADTKSPIKLDSRKVSPIKLIKGNNEYRIGAEKRKNSLDVEVGGTKKLRPTRDTKTLVCEFCDKQFPLGGRWKLLKHVSSEHNFICEYCDKQFICQSVLTAHTQWHLRTNPWNCSLCGFEFESLL